MMLWAVRCLGQYDALGSMMFMGRVLLCWEILDPVYMLFWHVPPVFNVSGFFLQLYMQLYIVFTVLLLVHFI